MVKRKIKYSRFVFAFIIAGAIFFGGIFVGGQLTSLQINKLAKYQEDLTTSLTSLELRHDLLRQNICGLSDYNEFSEELGGLGRRLEDLEKGFSKSEDEILKLKEPYFLLEIRHYMLLQEAKSKCGSDIDLVLYFYSNNEDECQKCEDQGYVLSYLQEQVGYDKLKIYSFDVNSQSPAVRTLLDLRGVETTPLLVVNDVIYDRFVGLDEMKEILGVVDEAQE